MNILKGLTQCWLSPSGKVVTTHPKFFYEYNYHNELALVLLADIWKLDAPILAFNKVNTDTNYSKHAYEVLEDKGWIRLFSVTKKWIIPKGKKLTKKQEETILDWCFENGKKYSEVLSD